MLDSHLVRFTHPVSFVKNMIFHIPAMITVPQLLLLCQNQLKHIKGIPVHELEHIFVHGHACGYQKNGLKYPIFPVPSLSQLA